MSRGPRTPKHVVFEVGRGRTTLLEEHVCFSVRDAWNIVKRNWPLADYYDRIVTEPYEMPQRSDSWI